MTDQNDRADPTRSSTDDDTGTATTGLGNARPGAGGDWTPGASTSTDPDSTHGDRASMATGGSMDDGSMGTTDGSTSGVGDASTGGRSAQGQGDWGNRSGSGSGGLGESDQDLGDTTTDR